MIIILLPQTLRHWLGGQLTFAHGMAGGRAAARAPLICGLGSLGSGLGTVGPQFLLIIVDVFRQGSWWSGGQDSWAGIENSLTILLSIGFYNWGLLSQCIAVPFLWRGFGWGGVLGLGRVAGYLGLVRFSWGGALRGGFNCYFSGLFCCGGVSILAGGMGAWRLFHEFWALSKYFLISWDSKL